jgi:hypothetical protein
MTGAKAPLCAAGARRRNAGTGFTSAPAFVWITVGSAGGRPVIRERGCVATRTGMDGRREPLYAEALRRGLGQAAGALAIGDGAVWIWWLADDRFPQARQRRDFYLCLCGSLVCQ